MGLHRARYWIYLNSSTWKNKRKRIIERAKGICEECKEDKIHSVHHLTYINIFNEPDEDLIGLCKSCHNKKHQQS